MYLFFNLKKAEFSENLKHSLLLQFFSKAEYISEYLIAGLILISKGFNINSFLQNIHFCKKRICILQCK